MTLYVTIATFQGAIDDVEAFLSEESAHNTEKEWLRQNNIRDDTERECKADDGTGFQIHECKLKP